ncbi:MAG: OmpH family outer membrane protein [Candidatus Aminicenantales bacterium]|jgi:Skp family chaperone for outer membrane proteins
MKKAIIIVPLTITLVLAVTVASFAQQTVKIVVVNSARAFERSAEGKKAIAQLQQRDAKIKADIQSKEDAIRALESRLNTGRMTMTQDALLALQVDIDKKSTERKRYEEDGARDFAQFRDNLVARIRAEMVTIIIALRKEKGYELVLDLASSGVVDFDPALDVTDEVIRRYDASKAAAPPVKK